MTTSAVSEDAVRTRAYLLWEADGRPFGRDAHYWGVASAEMTTPAKPKRAAPAAKPVEKKAKAVAKPVKVAAKAGKPAAKSTKPAAKPKKK